MYSVALKHCAAKLLKLSLRSSAQVSDTLTRKLLTTNHVAWTVYYTPV